MPNISMNLRQAIANIEELDTFEIGDRERVEAFHGYLEGVMTGLHNNKLPLCIVGPGQ